MPIFGNFANRFKGKMAKNGFFGGMKLKVKKN